ncbi:hypothetical protein Forpe1208_v013320 [Fusarium oxysporum f. sp. rapae]|uniref:BTB domain-containing protein n=1 Tax=Fusarium oxysporum f. sp. rapae TaxID=485398 RepID=A0A8J5TRJ3_FUSOX|nr:hypothetical protein Forpe1208_v013320 [Fusarium oxysporum f. sp. rapae]
MNSSTLETVGEEYTYLPPDSISQIIPDRDVILVVGPSQHKILVYSHFLERISPVFRAMLNAPMEEGEALASRHDDDYPVAISLPADKAEPMEQVLRTLYGSDPSASRFSMNEAKEIAIVAEKYGMAERLEVFPSFWLHKATRTIVSEATEDDWNAVVVAYLLKNEQEFFKTQEFQLTDTRLLKFSGSFHDKYTGMRLGMAIEELRSASLRNMPGFKAVMGLCLFCFSHTTESFTQQ